MIVLTIIARIGDGLILTESVQHDEEHCYIGIYLIYENVCYLALCEKSFSKRLAFAYLEDLKNEFSTHYGKMVSTAMRPYSCIEFDLSRTFFPMLMLLKMGCSLASKVEKLVEGGRGIEHDTDRAITG
ncbi:UNVERIFIED_CONTAM: Sec22b [Trichonephila clavipes]